jgi:hypothetical protein
VATLKNRFRLSYPPTEGGAMGAVGALALAILHRRLTWKLLKEAMDTTLKLTTMVMFILVGSTVFSLTFRGVDGDLWIEGMLSNHPGGVVGFLIFVNVFVFFLAFFLDYFEIAFIIIPLLAPVAEKMGIDLIWFGVLIGVNMQTSFMHPPFGFALFYLRSIAPPSIKSEDILWGSIPWVIIMLIMVALVILFPGMVALSIQIFGRFRGEIAWLPALAAVTPIGSDGAFTLGLAVFSSRGRISAAELAFPDETFEDVGTSHWLEAAGTVSLTDEKHDTLLVDQAPIDLCRRQQRIPGMVAPAADAADLDD